jgi:hypothetical protein
MALASRLGLAWASWAHTIVPEMWSWRGIDVFVVVSAGLLYRDCALGARIIPNLVA